MSQEEKLRPEGGRNLWHPRRPKRPVGTRGGRERLVRWVAPTRPRPTNLPTGRTSPAPRAATPALPPPSLSGPAARATATAPSTPASAAAPCRHIRCHLSLWPREGLHVSAGRCTHVGRGLAVSASRGARPGLWPVSGAGPVGGASRGAGPDRRASGRTRPGYLSSSGH